MRSAAVLQCCPYWLLNQQAVSEISAAYNWAERGQLLARYPHPSLILLQSIEAMASGVNRAQHDAMEAKRNKK